MEEPFDIEKAKKFLIGREAVEKEKREQSRKTVLALTLESLIKLFSHTDVEVYLVGSITRPYMFYQHSDVDVVLENFKGDRFEIWTRLEQIIHRKVEIILFENCHFQEHVKKTGYKVL